MSNGKATTSFQVPLLLYNVDYHINSNNKIISLTEIEIAMRFFQKAYRYSFNPIVMYYCIGMMIYQSLFPIIIPVYANVFGTFITRVRKFI